MRQKIVGRKRNREAKCKKRRKKNDKMDQKCAKYKKYCFFLRFERKNFKMQNILRFCFLFFNKKVSFFSILCNHKVYSRRALYTLHNLVFAIQKKLLQKGSFNRCGKNFKRVMRKKVKKWEQCDKWGKRFFCGLEVKILFRCPAEKELFTTKEKENSNKKEKKIERKHGFQFIVYYTSLVCRL